MDYEKIISNLALSLAQKEIDIATLKVQVEELNTKLSEKEVK